MTVCIAGKADGTPCHAHALHGEEYCFTHHPTRVNERAEARKAGGRARTNTRLPAHPAPQSLESAHDVRALLSDAIGNLLAGELDGRTANSLGYLCTVTLKAIQIAEVEERLRRIEAAIRPGEVIGLADREVAGPDTPFLLGVTDE